MTELNPSLGLSFAIPGAPHPGFGAAQRYPCWPMAAPASGTRTMTANKLYGTRFYVPRTKTFSAIEVYQTSAGTTGNIRLGIYNDSDGHPGTLFLDAGAVAFPGSIGYRSIATSIALVGGTWYWSASVADAALQVTGTNLSAAAEEYLVHAAVFDQGISTVIGSSPNWSGNGQGFAPMRAALAYGALPTPFGTLEAYDGTCPMIMLKG